MPNGLSENSKEEGNAIQEAGAEAPQQVQEVEEPAVEQEVPQTYPEHAYLKKISEKGNTCGAFLDWLQTKKEFVLCYISDNAHSPYTPAYVGIEKLLAEFFEIDRDTLEQEKQAMLAECSALSEKVQVPDLSEQTKEDLLQNGFAGEQP